MEITVKIDPYRIPETGAPCHVLIHCDNEGLEYLIEELSRLKKAGDHTHLMTPSWGMGDLSEEKQVAENDLVHHLMVRLY